ncbi:ribonuclease H-like domain-containing protein [Tanacetum coccineum]
MSIDDLYNNFKIVEQEVKRTVTSSSNSNSSSQNMAFVSSPNNTNEVNTANVQVSTANSPVSTADTPDSTANLSDATIYVFLENKPNGSQLVHKDIEQIHDDDLEEMSLKWQLALLSMRARRGRRNQDNRNINQDNSRRTVNVEETSSKAMVAIDGAGFDWSFMTDEEVPTNMALMAFSDSEAHYNYNQREGMVNGNNYTRVNYNYSAKKAHPNSHRNMTPRAVLMKTGLKPLNTARPVNTDHPKTIIHLGFLLASKDETSGILKNFVTEIENLVDKKVKIIRCDNGTEFKNRVMNEFCEKKGIKREFGLPTTFLAEADNTACYVQNRDVQSFISSKNSRLITTTSSNTENKDDEGLSMKKLEILKKNIKFRGGLLGLKGFMMILKLLLLRINQGVGSTSGIRACALRNFDLEVMKFETTQNNAFAKLPMLKLGEYEMWEIRIKQYFQIQDYALWKVIENGNSWVPIFLNNTTKSGTSTNSTKRCACSSEEKHYNFDAQSMFVAIKARLEANEAKKKPEKALWSLAVVGVHVAGKRFRQNMALMAFSDSEVKNDKSCSKNCLKNYEALKKQYDDLLVKLVVYHYKAATIQRGLATIREGQIVKYKEHEVLFSKEIALLKRSVGCKEYELGLLRTELEKGLNKGGRCLEEFKEPEVNEYGPRDSSLKPTTGHTRPRGNQSEWHMVKNLDQLGWLTLYLITKACFIVEFGSHSITLLEAVGLDEAEVKVVE